MLEGCSFCGQEYMAQTRTEFDECNYRQKVKQSEGPGRYRLFRGQNESCATCVTTDGPRQNRVRVASEAASVAKGDLVDLESLLTNRTYSLSKCPNDRTLYDKQAHLRKLARGKAPGGCDPLLDTQHSRLTHPLYDYKELHATRWEYPIIDPVQFVWTWNQPINSSLYIRDLTLQRRYPTRMNLN